MRCYLSGIMTLMGLCLLFAQTPITLEAGPISYPDLNTFVDNSYSVNVEECTSISFSVDYSFSLPWGVGSSTMDSDTDCPVPQCAGDPSDPASPGCDNCWDFMWLQPTLDGNTVDEELIGVSTNLNQSGTYTYGPICTDGATMAGMDIRNQNSAADEENTFSNVTLFCWEGVPEIITNSPVCGIANLDLDGSVGNESDVSSWSWTSDGNGVIDNPNIQNTFATSPDNGETYTLTATDDNSCTANTSQAVAAAAFTATLTGGGVTCIGNCTDSSSDVILDISGGTAPYRATFVVNGVTIPQQVTVPSISEVFRVCIDESQALPSFDDSQSPIIITASSTFFPFEIAINLITDLTNCVGTNSPDPVNISIAPQPNVVGPPTQQQFCTQANGTIDLTSIDDIINGGDNSLDVIYFESMDFSDEITDPANYQFGATNQICAVTYDGICFSDFVCFGLDFDIQPFVDNVMPIVDCSDGTYMLPPVLTIADVTPITAFEGYYLDAAGTDGPYTSVPVSTTTVYIVARSSGQSCDDIIVPVPVSLSPNPTINSPGNMIGGCGNVELPIPDATNFISYEYNTDEMGNGIPYTGGDIIEAADMINTIYLIMTGNNNCKTTLEIGIDITNSITYEAIIPAINCDSLILPAITPSTPTVAYYTMSGGMGTSIAPGTVVNAPFNATLFLFDPNQDPSCAAEVPINIIVDESPMTTLPVDTVGCGFYALGAIPGTTSMTPDYFIEDPLSLPPRIDYNVGDTIRSNSLIYISDTIGTCTLLDSIQINIIPIPYAGRDTMITACEGYSSTTINFEELIDNPDAGGTWSYPMEPDFAPTGPTMVEINTLTPGTYDFIYLLDGSSCGAVSAMVTLIVEPAPYAGVDSMLQVCNSTPLDFTELLSNPDTGGRWSEVPQDNFNFADSTSVDISTLVNGTYFFQYMIDNPNLDYCEPNTATLTLDVIDAPMAGVDQMTTACLGNTVNIRSLLSLDADADGVFFPNGFFISGDNWITTGNTPNQNYTVDYIVESTALGCPSDTATIDIFLTENLSAGQAVMISPPCAGIEVDLSTYLEDASAGGIFVLTSDYTTPVDNPLTVDVTTDISYIIEGTGGCVSDTTDFTVDVVPGPILDFVAIGNELCLDSGDCIEVEVSSSTLGTFNINVIGDDPSETYSFMQPVTGSVPSSIIFCADGDFGLGTGDTINLNGSSNSYELLSASFIDAQCGIINTAFSEIVNLNQSYVEVIDTIICMGDSIEVNGQFFSSSTDFMDSTVNGCDSTLQIMISNYPEATNNISGAFCTGTSVDIFGMDIMRDTVATFIEENASFFGCDSIINVDITFQTVATGLVDDIICDGMPVDVGGEMFDMNRPTGEVRLIGGSVAGCDSLITVDLTYGIPTDSLYTGDVCAGDAPIEINGTMYGPGLLSGIEILTNTSGCDSTITIDLSLVPAITVLRDDVLCDGDSEIINGNLYDIANASGTEMLTTANGCDSIITIDFTFIQEITVTRDDELCADGSEMINGVLYDINNPTGTEMLMTASGCDSTIIIDFDFVQNITVDRNDVLCEGDSEMINGNLYDINMPTGTEMLTSVNGCDSIININFTFMPSSATIGFDALCNGATDTQLNITELNGLDLPVTVSINGSMDIEYMMLPIVIPISSGTNDIMIDDGNCMYTETIEVQASMEINGEISSTTISANQTALSLTADGSVQNINWTTNNLEVIFSCTDCPEPIADSQTAYTATVTYEDENGCTYTDEIFIEIPVIEVGEIFIPNIFSLSVSGNDRFYPQSSLPPAIISEMRIFDRWGNVIFTRDNFPANDSDLGWDGTRDGKIIEQGVYVYLIKVNDGARDQFYSGSITVVR